MVIDSSALVAIAQLEPEADAFMAAILRATRPLLSAATWFETGIVLDRRTDEVARARFQTLLMELAVQVVPLTPHQAVLARQAYDVFGKGRHPARLNYGDCFAYALAKDLDQPLLYKGGDFSKTDIRPALAA